MTGFALVAYPAESGTSGVMTFVVGPQGVVYQKDLGDKTVDVARSMKAFDPDESVDAGAARLIVADARNALSAARPGLVQTRPHGGAPRMHVWSRRSRAPSAPLPAPRDGAGSDGHDAVAGALRAPPLNPNSRW